MQRRSWGRLVAAHLTAPLLSACSAAPPPAPPSRPQASAPAPAASAEAPPEVDPTAGPAGLEAWAPLTAPQPEVVHAPRVFRVAATDRGVVGLVRSSTGDGGCAWNGAADEACTGFFFAPWKDGKGSPARFPVGAVGAWAPIKTSRNWSWIWPGREGAYALGDQGKQQIVAVIDGKTERLFTLEGSVRVEQIVETSKGPVALWNASGVTSAPLTLSSGRATLGTPTRHRVANASTAQQARDLLKAKKAPAVEWAAIPNLDDAGGLDSAFLLTWSEALPPEKNTDRVSASERRTLSFRNMMCGFSPSRSVADPSVVKRIMVQRTRREGQAEGPPREIARSEAGKEAPLLRLETRPKARERLVGEGEQVELPAGLKAPPEQEIVAAGYEPARHEGVVVLSQAGELLAQVIDPLGKPSGAPVKLGPSRPVEPRAVFALGGWVVPAHRGASLLVLTGPKAGAEVKARFYDEPLRAWGMVGAHVVATGQGATIFGTAESDPGALDTESALVRADLSGDFSSFEYRSVQGGGGAPLSALVRLDDGRIAAFSRVVRELDDPPSVMPAAWRDVFPKEGTGKPESDSIGTESALVEVIGDHVLVHREGEGPLEGVWLRSGKAVPFEGTEGKPLSDFSLRTGGGLALLPSPGPPAPVAPSPEPPRGCVDELAVGPRARLLLCYKPQGSRGFLHTAGVRVMRFLCFPLATARGTRPRAGPARSPERARAPAQRATPWPPRTRRGCLSRTASSRCPAPWLCPAPRPGP